MTAVDCLKLFAVASVFAVFTASASAQAQTPEATFNAKVKPILDANCAGCHIGGGHHGGLRLDTFSSVMAGSENGPVIRLGNPDDSTLVRAIRYKDTELQMPPRHKLADADIATIEKWVKESGKDIAPTADAPAPATNAAAAQTGTAATPVTPEQKQFFEGTIRPILENNCYGCHGAEKQRGGLRVDSREALLKGGRDGAVVTPGDPEHSLLITAVRHTDPELKMPPRRQLTADEVNALVKWVGMGLPWPQ